MLELLKLIIEQMNLYFYVVMVLLMDLEIMINLNKIINRYNLVKE